MVQLSSLTAQRLTEHISRPRLFGGVKLVAETVRLTTSRHFSSSGWFPQRMFVKTPGAARQSASLYPPPKRGNIAHCTVNVAA
jgi:hypothetical protein